MRARIAYVVSAYKYPEQLGRLIRRLSTPNAVFSVHVDAKTSGKVFEAMRAEVDDVPGVTFLPRHRCHWAGFGHVRATLKGVADVLERNVPFDYAVLLTGQDYPLRAPAAIERVLGEAGGRSFMNYWSLPYSPWGARGGMDRLEDWHLITYGRRQFSVSLKRRLPGGLRPYGGGSYWCLARPVVEELHEFVSRNADYVRFFHNVWAPDELFVQTIVLNSPLRDTVVNDNLRYIDWTREPAPAILRTDDFPLMMSSGKLFARKFDASVDEMVLDMLDESMGDDPDSKA